MCRFVPECNHAQAAKRLTDDFAEIQKPRQRDVTIDCKTVRIFGYSSKREQSNERSGTRLKTESETGERR